MKEKLFFAALLLSLLMAMYGLGQCKHTWTNDTATVITYKTVVVDDYVIYCGTRIYYTSKEIYDQIKIGQAYYVTVSHRIVDGDKHYIENIGNVQDN